MNTTRLQRGLAIAACGLGLLLAGCSDNPHHDDPPAAVAPAIVTQPADASVTAGAAASFSAAASGTPAPDVHWQRSTDSGATWTDIAGAVATTYTTPATTLADSGQRFRAVFVNTAGSATSAAAALTVAAPTGVLALMGGDPLVSGSADGSGDAARFSSPIGLAADAAGNVYVADYGNATVRKVDAAGTVTTLAGLAGNNGYVDGTGSAARFDRNAGIAAADAAGNVYVADTENHVIRKVAPDGTTSTLAGLAGTVGADDGTGSAARFFHPVGLSLDAAGNVYVADQYNHLIRKVTPAGVVTTLAGMAGTAAYVDGTGTAAGFYNPTSTAVDAAGNVYVADYDNQVIRRIAPGGAVTTFAGMGGVRGSSDGAGAAATFSSPQAVCVDPSGDLYVADTANSVIRKVTAAGIVSTVLGLLGDSRTQLGADARVASPNGIACRGGRRVAVVSGNAIVTATLP